MGLALGLGLGLRSRVGVRASAPTSASTSASARRGWALGPLAGAAGRLSDRGGAALLCWKLTMMGGSLSARVC